MKVFKLIVSVSPNSIDILRYISKNISDLNKMGVRIRVDKIGKNEFTAEVVDSLKKRNIVRLPALIAPEGKVFAGVKSITDLIERNLNNLRGSRLGAAIPGGGGGGGGGGGAVGVFGGPADNAEMGSNPDLSNYWMREMFAGTGQNGRRIPRTDKEESPDEGADIEKRMAEARRNIPAHRRTNAGNAERDIDLAPRTRRRQNDNYNENDNIAGDDDGYTEPVQAQPIRAPRLGGTGNARDDDLDQRMLAAWLDNNHNE